MAPPGILVNGVHDDEQPHVNGVNGHANVNRHVSNGRKLGVYDDVHFDPSLKPKAYQMKGMCLLRLLTEMLTIIKERNRIRRCCSLT